MSVIKSDRKDSRAEYVEQTRKLVIEISRIVANKPKKYKENFGDHLIKTSLEALELVQTANTIYLRKETPQQDRDFRRTCLIKAKAKIQHVSTVNYIFLELCRNQDGIKGEKIAKGEAKIGKMCGEIVSLINGVIKSDKNWL